MKQILYTLAVFCAFGLASCRKSSDNITIQQHDDDQIQAYIKANGLTGMVKDTSGGDTTGIYYQIITPGTGAAFAYSDKISYVYTVKSFDGGYSSNDTILNHINTFSAYVGPNGLGLAVKNIAKRKGTKLRVLIPSRLAYGINGTTISGYNTVGTVTYGTVGGNQCLDYTVNILDENGQAAYDNISIQKYMAANGLTGYTKTASGIYYKITQAGTGTDPISVSTNITVQYTGLMFNGIIFDQYNTDDGTGTPFSMYEVLPSWQEILPKVTAGAKLSFITPTSLGYGQTSLAGSTFTIPAFSCLRFDLNLISVQN